MSSPLEQQATDPGGVRQPRLAPLKAAAHFQTFARTRHRTEQGEGRSKVAKRVSKSAHFTPSICLIQKSNRVGKMEAERSKSDSVWYSNSVYQTRNRSDIFFILPRNHLQSALADAQSYFYFGVLNHHKLTDSLPLTYLLPASTDVLSVQMSNSVQQPA